MKILTMLSPSIIALKSIPSTDKAFEASNNSSSTFNSESISNRASWYYSVISLFKLSASPIILFSISILSFISCGTNDSSISTILPPNLILHPLMLLQPNILHKNHISLRALQIYHMLPLKN